MGLIFWWMILVWLVLIGGYWLARYLLIKYGKQKKGRVSAVPIAHSDRLTNLPAYKEALKRYRLLLWAAVGTMALSLLMAVVLSARPAAVSVITPAQRSRDVMLCLDVSGSVLRTDSQLVNRFRTLVANFSGQRFGLTVFNSSSVVILPLSDDYDLINEQLQKVGKALQEQKGQDFVDLTSGTLAAFDKGTSLVGDGLTSCINNLGDNPTHRSQSVILATDNEQNGEPIISMAQAAGLAERRTIRVYAIDPGSPDLKRQAEHADLKKFAEQTGGGYYLLSSANFITTIIDEISAQEAKYTASLPVVATADIPTPFLYVAVVTTAVYLVLSWRLRL